MKKISDTGKVTTGTIKVTIKVAISVLRNLFKIFENVLYDQLPVLDGKFLCLKAFSLYIKLVPESILSAKLFTYVV